MACATPARVAGRRLCFLVYNDAQMKRVPIRVFCWHGYGPIERVFRVIGGALAAAFGRSRPSRWNRMEACAEYIRGSDAQLVCLQEAWLGVDVRRLRKGWSYGWRHRPRGWLFPFTGLWPYSGLLTLANDEPLNTVTLRYSVTSKHKGDWVARKGAAFTQWPFGWLCNTHLDSGREPKDWDARGQQITELITAPNSLHKPFILTGDLNLMACECADDRDLARLMGQTHARCIVRKGLDFVLASRELLNVVCRPCPDVACGLSDHPPLCVEILCRDSLV